MVETKKLVQRMKKNDGSLLSAEIQSADSSKKRKSTSSSSPEERLQAFARYGVDTDQGNNVQDENQTTRNRTGNGDTSTAARRTNGTQPATKKHKPPQPATSALLNYFTRVKPNDPEAQTSLKALYDQVHAPELMSRPATCGSGPEASPRNVMTERHSNGVQEPSKDKDKAKSRREPSKKSTKDVLTGANPSKKSATDVHEEVAAFHLESGDTTLQLLSDPPSISPEQEERKGSSETSKSKEGASKPRSSLSKLGKVPKSKQIDLQGEVPSAELTVSVSNNRSMFEYFRPKSMTSLSMAANAAPEVSDTDRIEPEATVSTVQETPDQSICFNLSSDSPRPVSISISEDEQDIQKELSQEVESSKDETLQRGTDGNEPADDEVALPRRRRLVRGSNLARKKYYESSASDDDGDAEGGPKLSRLSKARKSDKKGTTAVQTKKQLSPDSKVESGQESEQESEKEHSAASKQLMRNFFGVQARPTEQASRPEIIAPKVSTESDSVLDEDADAVKPTPLAARPALKTYQSKAKTAVAKTMTKKKKERKTSSFSDSDESGRDAFHSDSDDDLSDFQDLKVDEKPDPNQKAITSMFSKASSLTSAIKPQRRKRQLTAASRSLLSGGLSNFSNSCYLNSVLQALRNTAGCSGELFVIQESILALEDLLGSEISMSKYQRSFFDYALSVFRELNVREGKEEMEETDTKSAHPTKVLETLREGDSLFNSSEQQDAAEFLLYAISQFDDVFKALLEEAKQAGSSIDIEEIVPQNWQPINNLFQVGTQTVTHCQRCPSVSVKVDRGIDMTVQIDTENPTKVRDLEWGISETMKMEHLKDDNQRFCEKCDSKEDAHIFHYLTSLPKILILRLQRYDFNDGAVKLQNSVSCTERMNFRNWMSQDYNGADPNYELCAIIVHRGLVITSGHYYVYIRKDVVIETVITDPDGVVTMESKSYRWLKYNDSSVEPVPDKDMEKVFSGNASASDSSEVNGAGTSSNKNDGDESTANGGRKHSSMLNSLFDDDLATPYVYFYRRLQDE